MKAIVIDDESHSILFAPYGSFDEDAETGRWVDYARTHHGISVHFQKIPKMLRNSSQAQLLLSKAQREATKWFWDQPVANTAEKHLFCVFRWLNPSQAARKLWNLGTYFCQRTLPGKGIDLTRCSERVLSVLLGFIASCLFEPHLDTTEIGFQMPSPALTHVTHSLTQDASRWICPLQKKVTDVWTWASDVSCSSGLWATLFRMPWGVSHESLVGQSSTLLRLLWWGPASSWSWSFVLGFDGPYWGPGLQYLQIL